MEKFRSGSSYLTSPNPSHSQAAWLQPYGKYVQCPGRVWGYTPVPKQERNERLSWRLDDLGFVVSEESLFVVTNLSQSPGRVKWGGKGLLKSEGGCVITQPVIARTPRGKVVGRYVNVGRSVRESQRRCIKKEKKKKTRLAGTKRAGGAIGEPLKDGPRMTRMGRSTDLLPQSTYPHPVRPNITTN